MSLFCEKVPKNQLQYNLSCPPRASNLESVCQKPKVITIEKVNVKLETPMIHSKQPDARDAMETGSQNKLDAAAVLAQRDIKNKKLIAMAKELGLFDDDPHFRGKKLHDSNSKKKPKAKKSVNQANYRIPKSDTHFNLNNRPFNVSSVNNSNANFIVKKSVSTPHQATSKSSVNPQHRSECLMSGVRHAHSQLHHQLDLIAKALKSVSHKITSNGIPPRSKGPALFMLDKDEDIIRRRMRIDEQNIRSTRTIYGLSRQIHDIQHDYQLKKDTKAMDVSHRIRVLTRSMAILRSIIRCTQMFNTTINDLIPSDGIVLDMRDFLSLIQQTVDLLNQVDSSTASAQSIAQTKSLLKLISDYNEAMRKKVNSKGTVKKKKIVKVPKPVVIKKKIIKPKSILTKPNTASYTNMKKDIIKHVQQETHNEKAARFSSYLNTLGPYLSKPRALYHSLKSRKRPSTSTSVSNIRSSSRRSRSHSRHSHSDGDDVPRSRSSSVNAPTISSMRRSVSAPPSQDSSLAPWIPSGRVHYTPVTEEAVLDKRICRSYSISDMSVQSASDGKEQTRPFTPPPIPSILKKSPSREAHSIASSHSLSCHETYTNSEVVSKHKVDNKPAQVHAHFANGGNANGDMLFSLVSDPCLQTMLEKLDIIQQQQDEIRSKWNKLSTSMPQPSVTNHSGSGMKSAMVEHILPSDSQTSNPPNPQPIVFTKQTISHIAEPHRRTHSVTNIGLASSSCDNIRHYRASYDQYLRKSSYQTSHIFDPWSLIQGVCDEILDDCVTEMTYEIDAISSDLVDHVCASEFTFPSASPATVY